MTLIKRNAEKLNKQFAEIKEMQKVDERLQVEERREIENFKKQGR